MTYRQTLRELAWSNHGIVTVRDAEAAGVPAVEVRKLASRGALERVGHGVYRSTEVPAGPLDEYAEAVAIAGPDAVLADEAVLAAHNLGQVNLRQIKVATKTPARKQLPSTIKMVIRSVADADRDDVDGIPAMSLAAALRSVAAAHALLPERVVEAAKTAAARGMISPAERDQVVMLTVNAG
ncbi:type IV toxin-antitoxin system AbiEi family antitoxin domain-containing protein [Actinotalea sp. C106]|uniref:type IV toxin-antitoxin system AbiEi family antitoxin domain-containing protein n=1 Tax=Actinotalea sp. C106 TaxID=2908644 RepID=UPI00202968BE|nr:type IV toxin-antitoxin system AbiEi family antitoxin domain-containing protein [Actinotalea sp. C106]